MTPPDPRDALFDVTAPHRTGRASILVLAMSLAKLALHLGSTILLARLIPPAEYGIAALALPVTIIVMNLSQFGLAQPIVQMKHVTHALVNTLFWLNLALGLLFATGMIALSGMAARFYGVPQVGPVFAALSLQVVFSAILTPYVAILRRRFQIAALEYGALAAFGISLAVAITAALMGASYWAIVLQQVTQAVLNVAIYAACTPWRPTSPLKIDLAQARSALGFGGNLAAATLMTQIAQALPIVLIGRFTTPLETGLYQRASTLAQLIPARTVTPLSAVYVSALSRLQDDPPAFRATFRRMQHRLDLVLMPIGVLAITTSDIVVPVVLGPDWAAVAPILAWLSLVIIQIPMDQSLIWALTACAASRVILSYSAFIVALVAATLWGVGFDRPVAQIAMALMLANQFIAQPVLIRLAVQHTHLDLRSVLATYVVDLAIAVLAIALILWLRQSLP